MKRIFFLSAFLISFALIFSGLSAKAWAIDCGSARPSIVVKTYKHKTKFIRNFTTGNLTQLHTGSYRAAGPMIFGLGGGAYGLKSRMEFKIKKQGSLACVSLDEIEGQFVSYPSVMIARNFRKGSCEYNAVLGHEKKHVRALLDFQQEYARKFKIRLGKIIKRHSNPKIVSISQVKRAQQQIKDNIEREIKAYFEQIKPVLQERQQGIDSPQEYARVMNLCSGWNSGR
jgi:hypothetical protein